MTDEGRRITRNQIHVGSDAYAARVDIHCSTQQSHHAAMVPSAFPSASSGTFNFLFKVLFIFPSWYLFDIGLKPILSLR